MQAIGQSDNVLTMFEQGVFYLFWIGFDHDLHLANQYRVYWLYTEAAAQARQTRSPGKPGNNGRFLDHQRHDIVAVVDQKVQRYAHGQAKYANHIFNHFVGDVELHLMVATAQQLHIFAADETPLLQGANTLGNWHAKEVGNPRRTLLVCCASA